MHYAAMQQSVEIPFFTRSLRYLKIYTLDPYIIFIYS